MSLLALPIAGAIAAETAEIGVLASELFGTSLGSYVYGSAVAYTGTKVAGSIEEQTGITETASSYLNQAKSFYLAQELQDPNIFLKSQGHRGVPGSFTPNSNEARQVLNNEGVEQETQKENIDRNIVFATTSRRELPPAQPQPYNYSPQDLLKVVYDISNKASEVTSIKSLNDIIDQYSKVAPPYLAPLVNIVEKYVGDIDTDIENNPKYKEIENVFNMISKLTGRFLDVETSYVNENGMLYFIDELGNKLGPMVEGFEGVYVPMVYGEYGGPLSRNSTQPIDRVDLSFFAHDLDFAVNGYLDYNSDLKLISRLNSLLKARMVPTASINLIKSIIVYFSTAGLLLDRIKGTAGKPIGELTVLNELDDDIFLDLRPDLIPMGIEVDEINDMKQKFFIEMEYAKDDIQLSSGSFQSIQSENIVNEISRELENMIIQVI